MDTVQAGDVVYIPAGVPHQPFTPTDRPARALVARTDPNEQESVVLLRDRRRVRLFHVEHGWAVGVDSRDSPGRDEPVRAEDPTGPAELLALHNL